MKPAFRWLRDASFAALALLWLSSQGWADERILAFHSDITVHRDGTLDVRETIRVRAEGHDIRRGIYRDFPTIYPREGGGQVVVGFSFQSATRDGSLETWRVENQPNGKRIYLGSAQRTLPRGEHTYELVYRTDRQMGFFADHDELYWNVTGNGWNFPIDSASASVRLPDEIPPETIQLEAYTGPQGAKGRDYRAEMRDGKPYYLTTRPLPSRQGLTIVASWPKGYIQPAVENSLPPDARTMSPGYDFARDSGRARDFSGLSPAEKLLKRPLPLGNTPLWIALAGFLGLLGYYYLIWDKVGRDPPGRVIIPEYQPPSEQSPASMRYILRMGYDDECFAAAVLSLAVKGYLRIQQDAGALGFGKTFTLIKQPAPDAGAKPLSADERVLLDELFSAGTSLELEQKNHRIVRRARREHDHALEKRWSNGFFHINGGWHFLGIVISLVALVALTLPGNLEPWPRWYLTQPLGWLTASLAIAGIILNGVFGKLLKAPTPKGRAAMDHIHGFRMYLEVAEGEGLKQVTAPPPLTPQLFEAYLPAALALDVEQKWAEQFAEALNVQAPNYQPHWYSGPGFEAARLGAFSAQLGKSLNNAISSSSHAPGSKSGRGGGGSSGGGGGGGGGGGW